MPCPPWGHISHHISHLSRPSHPSLQARIHTLPPACYAACPSCFKFFCSLLQQHFIPLIMCLYFPLFLGFIHFSRIDCKLLWVRIHTLNSYSTWDHHRSCHLALAAQILYACIFSCKKRLAYFIFRPSWLLFFKGLPQSFIQKVQEQALPLRNSGLTLKLSCLPPSTAFSLNYVLAEIMLIKKVFTWTQWMGQGFCLFCSLVYPQDLG